MKHKYVEEFLVTLEVITLPSLWKWHPSGRVYNCFFLQSWDLHNGYNGYTIYR